MNIWKEIEDLEEAKTRLSESQDRILDMYEKNNPRYTKLLKETVELQNDYDILIKKYKELAKEYQ